VDEKAKKTEFAPFSKNGDGMAPKYCLRKGGKNIGSFLVIGLKKRVASLMCSHKRKKDAPTSVLRRKKEGMEGERSAFWDSRKDFSSSR